MKLIRKKSIEFSIELWEWLAETGRIKKGWEGWVKYKDYGELKGGWADCFLCEYDAEQGGTRCTYCPYFEKFGSCCGDGNHFMAWESATTKEKRKEFAKLFLAQLKEL